MKFPSYLDNVLANFNENQSHYSMKILKLKHPTPRTKGYQESFFAQCNFNLFLQKDPENNSIIYIKIFFI